MILGAHVSIAGGLPLAVERARELGCTTMQIFSRSPRGWAAKGFVAGDVERFKVLRAEAGITPLAVHAPYLINLASADRLLYQKSVAALEEEMSRCEELRADYLVVHVGTCHEKRDGGALTRVVEAVKKVTERARRTILLLENTAGEKGDIGSTLEELAEILQRLADGPRVGLCLDTCHAFAAGYDISHREGVNAFVKAVEKTVGFQRIFLIHANDSKKGLACHVDRHEHIGQGGIGREGFKAFVNHPSFWDLPFILETPKTTPQDDVRNMRVMRLLHSRSQ